NALPQIPVGDQVDHPMKTLAIGQQSGDVFEHNPLFGEILNIPDDVSKIFQRSSPKGASGPAYLVCRPSSRRARSDGSRSSMMIRNLSRLFASIWRMRSRVTPNR